MTMAWPLVTRLKCARSSGSRHGSWLFRPMPPALSMATTIESCGSGMVSVVKAVSLNHEWTKRQIIRGVAHSALRCRPNLTDLLDAYRFLHQGEPDIIDAITSRRQTI